MAFLISIASIALSVIYALKPFLYISGENIDDAAQEAIFIFEGAFSLKLPKSNLKASVQPSETRSSFTCPPVKRVSKFFLLSSCQPSFWVEIQSGSVG